MIRATIGIVAFFLAVGYLSKELIIKRDLTKKLWNIKHRGIPITFAILLALAIAVISRRVGLHYIIGAYMAGLFISRLREQPDALLLKRIRLNNLLDDMTNSLEMVLTPLFFVYVGLTFNPNWGEVNLLLLVALIAVAFLGKIIGAGVSAYSIGCKKDGALEIGIAMCSRGSLELAVLHFGLISNVITPELFAVMVVTTLSTTILTPIMFCGVTKSRR